MLFREEKLSQSLPKSNFYFTNSPISPKTLLIFRFLCMTSSLTLFISHKDKFESKKGNEDF